MIRPLILIILSFLILLSYGAKLHPETDKNNFKNVNPGKKFLFPEDHRPHYGFKTEWWYYTGFVKNNTNQEYGIQFTLFKIELEPKTIARPHPPILAITHLGISDLAGQKLHSLTDAIRVFPGLAKFEDTKNGFAFTGRGRKLNTKYSIESKHHRFEVQSKDFSISGKVSETYPVLLQGQEGFSKKTNKGTASYYYSIPELVGEISLSIGDISFSGKSNLWLDHEVSSQFLDKSMVGWDWVHFTLNDGRKFSGFQVRSKHDPKDNYTYGVLIDKDSNKQLPIHFTPKKYKKLKSGHSYPISWEIQTQEETFFIKSSIDESEMEGILPYWEGPIEILNSKQINIGKGYLEMTGYGSELPSWL
jgi:predicted secreted hydrolase